LLMWWICIDINTYVDVPTLRSNWSLLRAFTPLLTNTKVTESAKAIADTVKTRLKVRSTVLILTAIVV
jgi:hypothetical protein